MPGLWFGVWGVAFGLDKGFSMGVFIRVLCGCYKGLTTGFLNRVPQRKSARF